MDTENTEEGRDDVRLHEGSGVDEETPGRGLSDSLGSLDHNMPKGSDHVCEDEVNIRRKRNRYGETLQHLKPIRRGKSGPREFPMRKTGLLNYVTLTWMNSYMWKFYRKAAIEQSDLWECPPEDSCEVTSQRLESLWAAEVKQKGLKDASMAWVFWRFVRTRFLVAIATQIAMLCFAFVGPTFLMQALLDYVASPHADLVYSLLLVLALFLTEFMRCILLMVMMLVSIHSDFATDSTRAGVILVRMANVRPALQIAVSHLESTVEPALRARSAIIAMLYHKIIKLRSLQDKSVGELVNLCANDVQRLNFGIILAPMIFGAPLIGIAATAYCCSLMGAWVLLAAAVFMVYYPYQILISRATTFLRRKAIVITDHRVRLMNEILTCIKLIKLYAWEKPFSKAVAAIRSKERVLLEKTAYVHTLSVAFAPIMPVIAAVLTFTAHTVTGHNLTSSQAFIFISVFTLVRLKLGAVPHAVRPIVESLVSFQRFKDLLVMEEISALSLPVSSPHLALEIAVGNFAWDVQRLENTSSTHPTIEGKSKLPNAGDSDELQKLNLGDADNQNHTQVLFNINVKVPKGQLLGVCGSVGSGKSSILSALLGQMVKLSGRVGVAGNVAYVSQQAWVMNSTLRDNILFGLPYEQDRYDDVVKQCCLEPDLEMLPAGDLTEVGERGINLSGGQKQRISLARAVYAQRDIYLLDDPLSAVDVHVGKHIFDCVFKDMLKGKTIVFITHQLQYLPECDYVVLIKDGRILEEGSHDNLMNLDGEYASLICNFHVTEDTSEEADGVGKGLISPISPLRSPSSSKGSLRNVMNLANKGSVTSLPSVMNHATKGSTISLNNVASRAIKGSLRSLVSVVSNELIDGDLETDGRLVADEELAKGSVSVGSYLVYMRSAGGYIVCALVILMFAFPVAITAFSTWWLAHWIRQGSGNTTVVNGSKIVMDDNVSANPALHFYTLVYGMTAVALILSLCIRGFLFMKTSLRASSTLHDKVFAKVLRSPMSFFDTTPVGRIINRFSKDMDEIDVQLALKVEMVLQDIMMVLAALTMVSLVFPWFLVAVVPLTVIFWLVNTIFRVVLREIKRLDGVTRSPVFSWLTASIQGLHTIHAYNKEDEFLKRFFQLCDENAMVFLFYQLTVRWLALRLDAIAIVITTMTGLFVVLSKGHLPTAMAGLAMAYAAQMTGLFQFTVRMMSEAESHFVSVERIYHYIGNVQAEAPPIVEGNRPPANWPQEGAISYSNYKVRYRKGLPLVLKGVSCNIKPREKIGIVGRTGAGKSSLGLSLFRLMEPAGGSIVVDGIDITSIGLDDLRSKLAIIPQDPVLFIGTIRYNLDPFHLHTDQELWTALAKCHLKDTIVRLEGELEAAVVENGENFSVGERQLMCMARALLRHSKILILDEATAAIDTETDALIQGTIREAFADCTLLTIAHRLHTIMDSDRVIVLSDGKIVEFDHPQALLSSPGSQFGAMVRSDR